MTRTTSSGVPLLSAVWPVLRVKPPRATDDRPAPAYGQTAFSVLLTAEKLTRRQPVQTMNIRDSGIKLGSCCLS